MADLSLEQKAAMVIIALGADKASKVYKFLGEDDVERLTFEISKLSHITAEQRESVLEDFYRICLTKKVISEGGLDYAKSVLEKAFGSQIANSLLDRVSRSLQTRAFEFLRKSDSKNLLVMIQHERPQTIALILSYARADQASDIISALPKNKQIKVVESMAKMDSVSPETIKLVEKMMESKFTSIVSMDFAKIGGVDYVADVMNTIDRSNEKFIFDELFKRDPKLAEEIRNKMFIFEDIVTLDERAIQKFLREIESKDLVYALKGANKDVANIIFANMSTRMAETVQSDLEVTFNVRLRDVEEAQQRIVAVIRRLEEEGELVISKGGKDEIIA